MNRPTSETIVLGTEISGGGGAYEATRSWQYDKLNAVVAYIDRNDRLTMNTYDVLGRKAGEAWYAEGDTPEDHGEPLRFFSFTHDALDRITATEDSQGVDNWYTFDALGNVYQAGVSLPDNASVTFTAAWDKTGRRTQLQDGQGTTTAFAYNEVGRLTSAAVSIDSVEMMTVAWAYQFGTQLTSIVRNASGHDQFVRTDFERDALGRLRYVDNRVTDEAQSYQDPLAIFSFAYDARNRLISSVGPEGYREYRYDERGQLVETQDDEAETLEGYDYDAGGNRENAENANGAAEYVVGPHNRIESDGVYHYEYCLSFLRKPIYSGT